MYTLQWSHVLCGTQPAHTVPKQISDRGGENEAVRAYQFPFTQPIQPERILGLFTLKYN